MTILRCFLSHKRWQMQVSVGISGQEMSKFQVVGILGNKKHQCQHVHSLKPTIHPSKTCGFVQRLSGFSGLVSKVPSRSSWGTVMDGNSRHGRPGSVAPGHSLSSKCRCMIHQHWPSMSKKGGETSTSDVKNHLHHLGCIKPCI